MTSSLVLVDVENLRPEKGDSWQWSPPHAGVVRRCTCPIDSAVVVLALGTHLARSRAFESRAVLDEMADDVLAALGLPQIRRTVEVVLALSAPEAADRALLMACRKAPEGGRVGPFHHVALLSRDQGLRKELSGIIRSGMWPKARKKGPAGVFLWCLKRPHRRRGDGPALVSGAPSPPASGLGPILFVDTDKLIPWAKAQQLQVTGPLSTVARAVEDTPALLTQVGLTEVSGRPPCARGVARLGRTLRSDDAARLGPCGRDDGLEIALGDSVDTRRPVREVAPSPLGNGAVRVWLEGGQTASMRTSLPAELVKRALVGSSLPVYRGKTYSLDDSKILRRWAKLSSGTVQPRQARFNKVNTERPSFCEIEPEGRLLDSWWYWIKRGTRLVATAKPDIPAVLELERSIDAVPCRPVILGTNGPDPALGWRVVEEVFDRELTLASPIAAGKVGKASWTGRDGRTYAAAVLAVDSVAGTLPGEELRAIHSLGSWVRVEPIVSGVLPKMNGRQWFESRLLPIIVAGWPE